MGRFELTVDQVESVAKDLEEADFAYFNNKMGMVIARIARYINTDQPPVYCEYGFIPSEVCDKILPIIQDWWDKKRPSEG